MTTFEIPTIVTDRLRLRAFQASDLDAYAAMQANPEVMRHMVMGRTSTRVEVWRTMATSLGSWLLRGYGMWACEKIPLPRAASFIRPENRASKRVVEKLGAVCERTFELRGSTYEWWVHYRTGGHP
jgi:RimJ/RimL family protein N-acetyltransferase